MDVYAPAQRNIASGQRPLYGREASVIAVAEPNSVKRLKEYVLRIWDRSTRSSYQKQTNKEIKKEA